jgi:DNA-directed RNA polymerase specialized sigma24 family protein
MSAPDGERTVKVLVVAHRVELARFLERQAGDLLRFEATEDLLHGLIASLLDRGAAFASRSPEEDRAWLYGAARHFLNMRRRYWSAIKRDSGRLLRTGLKSWSESGLSRDAANAIEAIAASQTGVSTFAGRREQLVLAMRALALLLPRDRELVEWAAEGLSNEAIAERTGTTVAAAAKAKSRAIERLRKTHLLVQKRGMSAEEGGQGLP